MSADLGLAFTAGFLGGFGHCVGMCGPVVAAFSLHGRGRSALPPQLLYHAGRIVTYTFIGALMGLGGSFAETAARLAGLQSAVSIAAGGVMVCLGLAAALPRRPTLLPEGAAGIFLRAAEALRRSASPLRYFPLGLLFGFLPCGLSWSVFVGAAATGDLFRGFLLALVFGMATVPALLLFGLVAALLGARARGLLYRAGGLAVAAMGVVFILRGIGRHGAL